MIENKHNKNIKGNCPNLRFPGFSEEWGLYRLSDPSFSIVAGGDIDKSKILKNGKYPVIANALTNSGIIGYYADYYRITAPAVTVTGRGDVGVAIARDFPFTPVVRLLAINTDHNNIFIANAINTHKTFVESTGVPQLTVPQLQKYKIYIPHKAEQQKIASFLSLIDARIATQRKMIEKLESLIKGLQSVLINSKSPTVRLKDCVDCHSSSLAESAIIKSENGFPVYGANGIVANAKGFEIDEDAILIIKDGAGVGRVQIAEGKYSVIGTLSYLTAKNGVNLNYIYYVLRYFDFGKYVVGSGIPHIYFKDYSSEMIYCPDFNEQNRIAELLGSISKKIETEQKILEKMREQKQYLLSNLFI